MVSSELIGFWRKGLAICWYIRCSRKPFVGRTIAGFLVSFSSFESLSRGQAPAWRFLMCLLFGWGVLGARKGLVFSDSVGAINLDL